MSIGAADPVAVERLTTSEVLQLARLSRSTLWRRVAGGRLPAPVDHGRQALFSKAEVIFALQADAGRRHSEAAIDERLAAMRLTRKRRA